jgi:predicted choloylglycine hydrolase
LSEKIIKVSGTHYEMGWQHGLQARKLRPLIRGAIKSQFSQIEQDGPDERFESLLFESMKLLQEVDPPILEMIQGQADGLELRFETLLRYGLARYLHDDLVARRSRGEGGCTTWAASGPATADGKPILAKNRDSTLEHLPLQLVVRASPRVGYSYAYVTSAGSPGVFCAGMNEVGLAVADTHVCSTDVGPGLPDYSLMMHILEEHSDVRSALDYLRSVARMGRNSLILADASGDLAVLEIGHNNYGLIEADDHILVNTSHFVSSQLRHRWVENEKPHLQGNSQRRHQVVRAALTEAYGQVDAAWARALMARHGGSLDSLCRHVELGGHLVTICAMILLPPERAFWTCFGYPCQGNYCLVSVEDGKPLSWS